MAAIPAGDVTRMTPSVPAAMQPPIARLRNVGLRYGKTIALDRISLDLPAGGILGFIGPDGVGKSSLFSLIAGSRSIQAGQVNVLGGSMADRHHRRKNCPRMAYMPQGLGKNLYPTLSVFENVEFFARLFGHNRHEREFRIAVLLEATGLASFAERPAGKLSGGMKQKLGLCCALIHDPELLILDEPTTGVDPLSRRQFWELIERIRADQPGMSVLVATAYMEEAARFDWLVAMNGGRVLSTGTPQQLLNQTATSSLEEAFITLIAPVSKGRAEARCHRAPQGRGEWRSRNRGPQPYDAFRRLHRCRSCQFPHWSRRDIWILRLQWLWENHYNEDVDRPFTSQ